MTTIQDKLLTAAATVDTTSCWNQLQLLLLLLLSAVGRRRNIYLQSNTVAVSKR